MIQIQALDRLSIRPFLLFIRPGFRQLLLGDYEALQLVVFGASFWGQPAGLLLAQYGETAVYLFDLYVYPSYRRAGIGERLLTTLDQHIQGKSDCIETRYKEEPQTEAFQQLLAKQGWQPPQHSQTVFSVQTDLGIGDKRWVQRYHFRPPNEAISWVHVTEAQKEVIRQRGKTGWYPADLSPFLYPNKSWDPLLSVALRCGDEILGWALSIRHSKEEQTVEIMFVDPPLQPLGRGMMLVGELVRRSIPDGIERSHWRVAPDNEPMQRWARRAFAGTIFDEYIEWTGEKVLR